MKQRVITAVIALIIFIPILYVGGLTLDIAAAALAAVGVYELFRMRNLAIVSFEGVLSIIGAVVLVLPVTQWLPFLNESNDFLLYYLTVMIILGFSVISKNTYTFDEAGFPVLVSLYVGMGFQNLVTARRDSLAVLIFAFFIVWATDIGAYMVGRKIGKRKLWPDISPNKTVEGALGGILCAVIVAVIFLIVQPNLFSQNLVTMMLFTVIFSIVGQFGDLVESAIKRHYDVKDSGKILPGHGGILDRFDSMLFVFPVMHLLGVF
ncbi:phosphatidate cytidylyltransferase [Enterococcus sp. CSURQ0835]|uniref:phosphatidate cytidylyltransferase n=1 Tax=Enterococcus sp. CSURQ0835 TaxID=2681394 RepID=UPI00135B334D|nr:phosphatidate cytidylyltransferase [Enterococcus sp. CSURQ0835]